MDNASQPQKSETKAISFEGLDSRIELDSMLFLGLSDNGIRVDFLDRSHVIFRELRNSPSVGDKLYYSNSIAELFDQIAADPSSSTIIFSPSIVELQEARRYSELLEALAENPDHARDLSPRQFEELTAEVLSRLGHEVELTPEQKDGGFDIAVRIRDGFNRHLMLVECKRYERPIGVGVVRSLLGVVQDKNATSGLVVATSSFTRDAKKFEGRHRYRIGLADRLLLKSWCAECLAIEQRLSG